MWIPQTCTNMTKEVYHWLRLFTGSVRVHTVLSKPSLRKANPTTNSTLTTKFYFFLCKRGIWKFWKLTELPISCEISLNTHVTQNSCVDINGFTNLHVSLVEKQASHSITASLFTIRRQGQVQANTQYMYAVLYVRLVCIIGISPLYPYQFLP